jgi:hypothetical protein
MRIGKGKSDKVEMEGGRWMAEDEEGKFTHYQPSKPFHHPMQLDHIWMIHICPNNGFQNNNLFTLGISFFDFDHLDCCWLGFPVPAQKSKKWHKRDKNKSRRGS